MDDTTAVVTGASRGIGAAVARLFAAEGARVVICAREADAVEAVAAEIRDAGGSATAMAADVRDPEEVAALFERAAEARLVDVVVANAGIYDGPTGETPLSEEPYGRFDEHLRTNARGVFATLREAVPHLAPDARALVPSGTVAREAEPGVGSYAVSKAAAEAVARGFAAEIEQAVGVVDPGQVTTALTDGATGRDPEDVAPMFRWAAVEAPAEDLDGQVLGLREWRMATR